MKSEIWINSGIYYTKIRGNITQCKITSLQLDMGSLSYCFDCQMDASKAFHSMSISTPLEDILFTKKASTKSSCRDFVFYNNPLSCYNGIKEDIVIGWDEMSNTLYGPCKGNAFLNCIGLVELRTIGNFDFKQVMSWYDTSKTFLGFSWKYKFKLASWVIEDGEPKMTFKLAQSCVYDYMTREILPLNVDYKEGFYATKEMCLREMTERERQKEIEKIPIIKFRQA